MTTPSRTLFDLSAVVDRPSLERAVERADALRLTDTLSLAALLTRHPRRPGAAALRAILGRGVASVPTRSELEDRFLAFLDAHGLARPLVNTGIEVRGRWMECACVWLSHRLIVELDGRATHDTAAAFERDRARRPAAASGRLACPANHLETATARWGPHCRRPSQANGRLSSGGRRQTPSGWR